MQASVVALASAAARLGYRLLISLQELISGWLGATRNLIALQRRLSQ